MIINVTALTDKERIALGFQPVQIEQSESFEDDSLTQQQEIELEKIEALKIAKLWGK